MKTKFLFLIALALVVVAFVIPSLDVESIAAVSTMGAVPFIFTAKSKFEDFLKDKGIENIDEMEAADQASLHGEYVQGLKDALTKMEEDVNASETEKKALKAEVTKLDADLATKISQLMFAVHKQGKELIEIRKSGLKTDNIQTLKAAVKQNMDALKKIAKTGTAGEELVIKAMTTQASIGNSELGLVLPDIGQLAHKAISLYDLFIKRPVSTGTHGGRVVYYDWNQSTTVRAAEFKQRGELFPESTAKWQKYSIDLKKVGDTLPVDAEFFEDDELFYNELQMFLLTNVDLKIDSALYSGDGVDEQLLGLNASISAYVPVASGITDASLFDLAVKVKSAITVPYGGKYRPDVIIMNGNTINKYKLKKDGNQNYILPPFVSGNGTVIDGMTVVESNAFPDNYLVVGDRRFAEIWEMPGITFEKGYVDAQFAEDTMTLKVRKRLLFLIRTVNKTGWLKVTDVDAAIATLAANS